jgi:MraZ protein
MFFVGQFHHNIDDKGRLTIPARFRDQLQSDGAYVMLGMDHNLLLLTLPQFESIAQQLLTMNTADASTRDLRRLMFGTAERVEIDKAGRILISQTLKSKASIESDVIMAGTGLWIELWSPDLWETRMALLEDADANEKRFSALDLTTS